MVPDFLALAGSQLRKAGQPLQVILIASPFHINPDDPAWNMDDAYPSDAMILANQSESIFGTAQKKKLLADVTVHYAYLRECFLNEFHRERTMHFWTLFIREQQGILATFAPDLSLAFDRARRNVQEPCLVAEIERNDTKIEMRHVVQRAVPVWIGNTNMVDHVKPMALADPVVHPEPPLSSSTTVSVAAARATIHIETNLPKEPAAPAPQPQSNSPPAALTQETANTLEQSTTALPLDGRLGVGITWEAAIDLDLYVKPKPAHRNSVIVGARHPKANTSGIITKARAVFLTMNSSR